MRLTTIAFVALFAVGAAATAKPDFSGEWRLSVGRSDFGERPGPVRGVMKVAHKDPSLKLTRIMVTGNGELTTDAVDRWQGDDEQVARRPRNEEHSEMGRFRAGHRNAVHLNGNDFTITWKWTLSADGKALTTVRSFGDGSGTQTEVYEKK